MNNEFDLLYMIIKEEWYEIYVCVIINRIMKLTIKSIFNMCNYFNLIFLCYIIIISSLLI